VIRVLGTFNAASMAEKMTSRIEWWDAVSEFATRVMVKKEDHERSKRGEMFHAGGAV